MKRELSYFAKFYEIADLNGEIVPLDQWPVTKVLRGEKVRDWQLITRRLDTGARWILSFSGEPVHDERGGVKLAIVVSRDITASKSGEASLHALADNIPQLAWMTDQDGWILLQCAFCEVSMT